MKLITYLITILMVLGSYPSLQGACKDGKAQCNDGTLVNWSCVYRFPGCQARDYNNSKDAAIAQCADHGGVNWDAPVDPWNKVYTACFYTE